MEASYDPDQKTKRLFELNMKVTEIEVHDITLEYCDWTSYQLDHY